MQQHACLDNSVVLLSICPDCLSEHHLVTHFVCSETEHALYLSSHTATKGNQVELKIISSWKKNCIHFRKKKKRAHHHSLGLGKYFICNRFLDLCKHCIENTYGNTCQTFKACLSDRHDSNLQLYKHFPSSGLSYTLLIMLLITYNTFQAYTHLYTQTRPQSGSPFIIHSRLYNNFFPYRMMVLNFFII